MDGVEFDLVKYPKPPKDWNEKMQVAQAQFEKGTKDLGANMKVAGSVIKEKSMIWGGFVAEKSKDLGAKAKEGGASLKEKIQTKEYG